MFSYKRIGNEYFDNADHLSSISNVTGSVINAISRFVTGYLLINHGHLIATMSILIVQ